MHSVTDNLFNLENHKIVTLLNLPPLVFCVYNQLVSILYLHFKE